MVAIKRHWRKFRPDAFVCGGDVSAAILRKTLEKLFLRIPEDVMLAGFGNLQISGLLSPSLTTIDLPSEKIGETAFRRLIERIAAPELEPTEISLPAPLVVRDSTKGRS